MNLSVKERNIDELIFADYNPRRLSKKQYEDLEKSLKKFELVEPIVINVASDRKNIIIGGHQRTKVWKGLGHETIPCVEIELNLEDEKELNIRLNKNQGEFDYDLLTKYYEVDDLKDYGFTEGEMNLYNEINEDEKDAGGTGGDGTGSDSEFDKKIELKVTEETYNVWLKCLEKGKECLGYENESKVFEFAMIEFLNIPEESLK